MKKEDFRQKAHSVLDEIINNIAEMEKKVNEVSDDMKEEYNERIARLQEIKHDLTKKLEDYEGMTENRWDVVKESFEEFLVRVNKAWKVSYRKASSAFKK
ncbi:MAG TPA: hypothetical protein GX746_05270 [Bacteroidales bacterium]|nr:hypothetical protein [Bacteroidales bacterium]